ncbi:MAG: phytoene desaturase family protein, partial [Candidatus Phosphoribacter sp.]
TMPGLFDDALAAAGTTAAGVGLHLRRLDPAYRAVYADGSQLRVRDSTEATRAEILAGCGPEQAEAFDRFVPWLERLYDIEMGPFIERNYDSVLGLLARPGAALRLLREGGLGRLGPAVRRYFSDERLVRLFSFQALYAGVSPAQARAMFAVITYMDSIAGVYYADGGIREIPRAMARALEQAGVPIHYGAEVTALLRRSDGPVAGVALASGDRIAADAVVCTLDLPIAYQRLLPDLPIPRTLARGTYSPSAVVWHVGASGLPAEGTAHHNIHFGHDWDGAFEALIGRGELMPDPSRLVSVPSLHDSSLAPDGHSTLYVLEPVPNLTGRIDWAREAGPLRERLLGFLDEQGYPTDIRAEHFVSPLDWQAHGMHQGTPFALAHLFRQSGPFRPANVEPRVPGLVFAGSGTTPGVGVPMVLVSGRLAAKRVDRYAGGPG